jgi:hypothetical protein
MKKTLILAVAALAVASQAKNYGTAGCGLGSQAFGPKGNQVSAATTNSTTATQFFGITSGTSNCAEDGVALRDQESHSFAEANFRSLRQEMAQGSGENLQVLASLMGCDEASFGQAARAGYGTIFAGDASSDVMLDRLQALPACTTR